MKKNRRQHEGLQIDLKEGRGDICRRFVERLFSLFLFSISLTTAQSFGKGWVVVVSFRPGHGTLSILHVQSARHISTGENVAIKCMKSSYTSTDEVAKLREIQVRRCSTGGFPLMPPLKPSGHSGHQKT